MPAEHSETRRLLVVDDDRDVLDFVAATFREHRIAIESATSGEEALARVRAATPDAILLDIVLPGIDGLETYRHLKELRVDVPVVIITSHGSMDIAARAMKEGAHDLLAKPLRVAELIQAVEKLWPSHDTKVALTHGPDGGGAPATTLVGRSRAMVQVYKSVGRVAETDATVLLVGESGSGKELVARAIHTHSRRTGAFLAVNCAAIPETLLESELFGYEKGAFTGADARRTGKFERAARGTVLLDEVGDLPLLLQGKMLRVLEERAIERLGGREAIPIDVRFIAATHRDLSQLVAAGRFREDLFFRLAKITIRVPPLRDRLEDLPLLTNHALLQLAPKVGRRITAVVPAVYEQLRGYHWPGNVRELRNVLEHALIRGRGPTLTVADLPEFAEPSPQRRLSPAPGVRATDAGALADVERDWIARVLAETGWNRTAAAERLGIHRNTLRRKIRQYGLHRP